MRPRFRRPGVRPAAWARYRDGDPEAGRAIIEFVFLTVLLLVPLLYLVVTLAAIQAASFAVATASREAGRAFMTSPTPEAAMARATAAASLSFEDFGFAESSELRVGCDGDPCLRPDGRVTVVARIEVGLPFVPDFVAGSLPAVMPVEATHLVTIDRFRAS